VLNYNPVRKRKYFFYVLIDGFEFLQIEYQTIVVASIVMQAGEFKSNIGIFNAISFRCGTRKIMEVFNSKAIPQGFSSTTGISKKLPAVRDKLSQFLHRTWTVSS
jgi:hypothetical protein